MQIELFVMKRSYKDPQTGDIFILQPLEYVYYYGKVIESKVSSRNVMFQNMNLIFIYNTSTNEIRTDIELDQIPLLIAPMVVNKRPWTMGYFETLKKSSITEYDLSIDYGFSSLSQEKFFDLRGNEMTHKPHYIGYYGLGSFGAIVHELSKVL